MSQKSEGGTARTQSTGTKPVPTPAPTVPRKARQTEVSVPPINDLDHLGDLPRSYGLDTIFLVAQEPHWLFTYWDIDISRHPGGQTFLRVYGDEAVIESEIEVSFETRNWYIPVKAAGAKYTVEIGFYRGAAWNAIAQSATIQTPPDRLSDSDQFDYATIPLHLSFQKLMENIETSIQSGESLIEALSRLQKNGKLAAFGPGVFQDLPGDQRIVLEALLGTGFLDELSSGSFSSEEIEARIRQHLEEKLSSGGSSEFSAGGAWSAAGSSLFSMPGTELSSWLSAALSSWPGETSSSWGGSTLSSWLQGAGASWSHAATASWAGGSETLSSFGQERSFFMHVNAEVIFYGGTDPHARVTIDGKPIVLNPDGTFRHHFIFPDGLYEIPIVATSPDGVETRRATLRFERGTVKSGKVDDTAQPALLAPMGAR